MTLRFRQLLALVALFAFSAQVLAGPLFVCDDMRNGPLMTAPAETDAHAHKAGSAHQLMGHAVDGSGHPDAAHQSPDDGHHCQHPCGLCLASTPFLSLSQQADFVVPPLLLTLPRAVLLLDRQPDTPFRPPIFA